MKIVFHGFTLRVTHCALCIMCVVMFQPVDAQKPDNSFTFGGSYTGDVVSNLSGGIKTGTTYLGMATINALFDTEKSQWWKGGTAFIKLANTHGGEPSATLVGDFQGVSNIEAGNLTWMYELWYRQSVGNFTFTAGLQDLNCNFAACDNGAIFTNSSFGVHSSLADNIPTPIFPLTALGFTAEWSFLDELNLKAAIFDGTPDDFENNPYNTNWQISKEQGFTAVTELDVDKSLLANRSACYKVGFYYHQHNDTVNEEQRNRGFYFVGDQQLTKNIYMFSQIGISPKSLNTNNLYYSVGLRFHGLISKRPDDYFGCAVAHAGIHDNPVGSETAIECVYQFNVFDNLYIRPDMQYIINPAGTDTKLPNALVAFVRVGVEF